MRQWVEVGYVARAHGIRGELRVVLHDPSSTAIADAPPVRIGDSVFHLTKTRPANDAWIVAAKEIPDRNVAETMRGKTLEVERDSLELAEGEVLLSDLIGCRAVLAAGGDWGEIVGVELGAHQDRLVVEAKGMRRELPLVDEFVGDIDLDEGVVVVAPPDGLPEEPI